MDKETRYLIALTKIPGVGSVTAKTLTAYCGSTEAVFQSSKDKLLSIPGIGEHLIRALQSVDPEALIEREIQQMQKRDIRILPYWDEDFPYRLKSLPDGPMLLFYRGEPALNSRRILGIVGTRSSTGYGQRMVRQIIEGLKGYDVVIVSGLAYGIDAVAHASALEFGMETIGVVAHGLDTIYPAAHRKLAGRMIGHGGLVTEFPTEVQPQKERFPMRNRIIAGLCDALLVVESGRSGGSMITVQYASDYDRQVFAVPGRGDDPMSEGPNYLISKQVAQLVTSAEQIADTLFWKLPKEQSGVQMELFPLLEGNEAVVMEVLPRGEEVSMDYLIEQTGLPISTLGAVLLTMEMKGLVCSCPGTRFIRY